MTLYCLSARGLANFLEGVKVRPGGKRMIHGEAVAALAIALGAVVLVLAKFAWRLRAEVIQARRETFIRSYVFPDTAFAKAKPKHPDLELKDWQLIARALREFFLAHLKSGQRFVGMPSKVVDDLWHEFILDTREYQAFCESAFGRYLHHSPAKSKSYSREEDEGLFRTWRFACIEENINWERATRLPLLFAIDAKLKIANGLLYDAAAMRDKARQLLSDIEKEKDRDNCGGFTSASSCGGGGGDC